MILLSVEEIFAINTLISGKLEAKDYFYVFRKHNIIHVQTLDSSYHFEYDSNSKEWIISSNKRG